MSVTTKFLYSRPQHEIATLLTANLTRCRRAAIVSGFLTADGTDALRLMSTAHTAKLSHLVIGAGTYRAFEALDRMINAGVSNSRVRIHLGHSRLTGGRKNPFQRYHPMLHSKVYFFELDDGLASAFVGSHNLTGFALRGLNGEAGILIEGMASDSIFVDITQHIDEAFSQGVAYDSTMKDAYAWWSREYFDGLRIEANDAPKDSEGRRTIVVLAAESGGQYPQTDDVIYFEIAEALREIRSLDTDVHIYLFCNLPSSPSDALLQLDQATKCLVCRTEGLEVGRGGLELDADWCISDSRSPNLSRTTRPFRPSTSEGMQQVRVRVEDDLSRRYEYLFDAGKNTWMPMFDDDESTGLSERTGEAWRRVTGLSESGVEISDQVRGALQDTSPESGSFILFSRRRRRR